MNTTSARQYIDIDKIIIKPELQPCKRQSKEQLAELRQSIQRRSEELGETEALFTPILVTNTDEGILLVDGESRLNVVRDLKIEQIWAVYTNVSEADIYSLRVMEKMKHGTLHPLDESDAYAKLTGGDGPKTITGIAILFAQDEGHVARRLKLQEISPEVRKAFEGGTISVDHAEVLAIYPVKIQNEALKDCFEESYGTGYEHEKKKLIQPVSELKAWLRRNGMLNLGEASFSKTDATLNPEMGACTICAYKTESQQTLFGDLPGGFCLLATCYNIKRKAHATKELKKAQEKYKGVTPILIAQSYSNKKGVLSMYQYDRCEEKDKGAVLGQFVDGKQEGKVVWIKVKKTGDGRQETAKPPSVKEKAKMEAADRERKFKEWFDTKLFNAVIQKCPKNFNKKEDLLSVAEFLNTNGNVGSPGLFEVLEIKSLAKASDTQLSQFILLGTLEEQMQYQDTLLEDTAKRWKVDVKKLKAAARKEFEKSEKAEPEKKGEAA